MPPRIRLLFSTLSLVLFFVAAVPLYAELSRRSDIWWTPHAMLVPLAESKDRVEIYAHGKPLAALLQAGQLRIAEDGGLSTLATSDVGLRFNNWDRVRVERLPAPFHRLSYVARGNADGTAEWLPNMIKDGEAKSLPIVVDS